MSWSGDRSRAKRGKRGHAEAIRRPMFSAVQWKIMNVNWTTADIARRSVAASFPRFPRPSCWPRFLRLSTLLRWPRLRRTSRFLLLTLLAPGCGVAPEAEVEPPQVLTDSIPFVYPIDLWDHNISGQTILLVRVNATGQVDSVAIDAGSGYAEFDSAAVQGAWQLRFIAARQGERRIPMWTKVPVRFARDTTNRMGIGGS